MNRPKVTIVRLNRALDTWSKGNAALADIADPLDVSRSFMGRMLRAARESGDPRAARPPAIGRRPTGKDRQALALREQGLEWDEIGQRLGLTPASAQAMATRARRRLRAAAGAPA